MKRRWWTCGFLVSFLLFSCRVFCAEPLLVGVLDEKQCATDKNERALIMFARAENGWISLEAPDSPTIKVNWDHQWTVGFNGKSLGNVKLRNPHPNTKEISDWFYAGEVILVPENKAPSIRNPSKLFGGWCDAPQTRPLVMVSEPNVKDSAGWKPFTVGSEYKQLLFEPFNRVLEKMHVINCKNPEQEKADPYTFRAEELKIYKGYRSNDKSFLIAIGLDSNNYHCDGPAGSAWTNHWFLLQNSNVEYIGEAMMLIDAGDYDGKAEVMFWSSGYNNDGYVLFYDDLKKKVEFKWHYH